MPLVDSQCQTDDNDLEALLEYQDVGVNHINSYHKKEVNTTKPYAPTSRARLGSTAKSIWMSKRVKRCLYLLLTLSVLGVAGILYFGFYCPEAVCALGSATVKSRSVKYE